MFRKVLFTSIIIFLVSGLASPAHTANAQVSHPNIVANVTDNWVEVWGLGLDDLTARLEVKRGQGEDIVVHVRRSNGDFFPPRVGQISLRFRVQQTVLVTGHNFGFKFIHKGRFT